MKTPQNNSTRAAALHITLSVALLFASAIWLASAAVASPTLGNYPDATLPLSTDMTVTPDAAPTGATSVNVATSTDFKGTLTGDPATGVVWVTDAHPAGNYTVTVTAFDSGGATATKTFALTVTTPVACSRPSFAPSTNLDAGRNPYSVVVGDFNADGKQDLAVSNGDYGSFTVSVLLGDGAGHFNARTTFDVGEAPWALAVGDFNGDGKQDLAVTVYSTNDVSILLGDGTGDFSAPTTFAVVCGPRSIAVGDFNGDGKQDLAVANQCTGDVSILLGDGAGSFSATTSLFAGDYVNSVAVGDFDGDGKQDLAATSTGPDKLSIFLGDGEGNFGAARNFAAGTSVGSVLVSDFNADGKQDIAVTNAGTDKVTILLGDGAGNFSAPTKFTVGVNPGTLAMGDFNADGKQDLATASGQTDSGNVSILLGDGTGHFRAATYFTVGAYPLSVAVGDFDGDGQQDLSVANRRSDNVSILLGECPVSQITPTGVTCRQFSSGTTETLASVEYNLNSGLIHKIVPHNFLYWVSVAAPAGKNTFRITQAITSGNFDTFFEGIGSNVFDADCVRLPRQLTQSGDTVTVRFNAPTAGTYVIAARYNTQNLIGEPSPNPASTAQYQFMTTDVSNSTSRLDLIKYPPPPNESVKAHEESIK